MRPKVVKIEKEESTSVQSESRPAASKPLSGQWTTRKKTPSKSLGPDEADDDGPDELPEDSERKRPPRRKRAWQSVKSEPEPENPCKKRAAIEDSHAEDSSADILPEGTRPANAPLTLPHVNAGGLTWVSKKSVPTDPVVIRDAETGEVIQRAIVEDFAVKCRPRPAPQPTSERPRYQGLDFKRFRKNEVHTSVVVIRCGDMQSETSSSNAVMTTLQEMFAGLWGKIFRILCLLKGCCLLPSIVTFSNQMMSMRQVKLHVCGDFHPLIQSLKC